VEELTTHKYYEVAWILRERRIGMEINFLGQLVSATAFIKHPGHFVY
jgi:hypothetical protein